MNTPAKNEKPKYTKKVPTEIEYHEKGQWRIDENVITVMGGIPGEPKQPIGYIKLLDYDEFKTPTLVALDLNEDAIADPSANLYQLKKCFREQELRLTKAMLIKAGKLEPETAQGLPIDDVGPENPPAGPDERKTAELQNLRRGNDNDNSQTISH